MTSSGANERYVYDGQDVLLDLNANGSIAASYLNDLGIDNHLRQMSAVTGVSYFLTDHLGSTAGLTDATGNLVEQIAYDSFGNGSGSTLTRYGYTGRERDADTGLYYYRARWYDSQVGRFISEDPIGFDGGLNFYAYVGNDPVGLSDPLGLCQQKPTPGATWGPVANYDPNKLDDCLKRLFKVSGGNFTGTRKGGGFTGVRNGTPFSLKFDVTSMTMRGIAQKYMRDTGRRATHTVGLSDDRNRTLYIASDFASNPNIVDISIIATEIHEVGNYIAHRFYTPKTHPRAKSKFLRKRDADAGMALEECVFGGGVASNTGQITTNQ